MNDEIDVATITEVNLLKALAYDRIAGIEQAQRDLGVINTRIAELAEPIPALNREQQRSNNNKKIVLPT
jgi:hypothetical protein